MRVLVSTTAGTGHFGPLVPFARACASAGHEVAVAAPASFADQVDAAGLRHHRFADVPGELIGPVMGRVPTLSFEEANHVIVTEVFGRLDAQAALPGLVEIVDEWQPDLILREPCEFGSLVTALAAGIPHVEVSIGLEAMAEQMVPVLRQPLAELSALAGLPDDAAFEAMLSTPMFTSVPPVLDAVLDSGENRIGVVHRFRDTPPSSEPGALPDGWGDPAHPLVYVSFGSVTAKLPGFDRIYPDVAAAFAGQPVRVLLTTGEGLDPAGLAPLPTNIRAERWWPQKDVMPHCAAIVGHGGFGTTMGALSAGVPQVIVPLFAYDQRLNAEALAAVGAGLHVESGPAGIAEVPDAVARLLADLSFREQAQAVADDIATLPPVTDVVAFLEDVARA